MLVTCLSPGTVFPTFSQLGLVFYSADTFGKSAASSVVFSVQRKRIKFLRSQQRREAGDGFTYCC